MRLLPVERGAPERLRRDLGRGPRHDAGAQALRLRRRLLEAPGLGARPGYGEGDGYAAVEMPYDGDELSMVLVLPSDIEAFDEGLDSARLDGVLGSLEPRNVTIELPIFRVESTFDLIPPLKDMGMTAAFGDADFSGIDGQGGLFISGVVHKAFVSVDEVGTEAAAATAVILDESGPPEPAAIRFDRPFFFFIRDNATSAILFVGRVADPSA
ncbi:serpin family protein [Sorangium sp. So ce1504]|uniref:serpin family protein n=1 Tax=Sorangium sp. So ce1504 TaxID=3133337 RepID=UPI003F5EC4FF